MTPEIAQALPRIIPFQGKGVEKYGVEWPAAIDPLTVELACYRLNWPRELGGLGNIGHFKEVVNILWGEDNDSKQFDWNPWSDRMLEEALRWKYLSMAGCASSGKSLFCAVYAIVNWLSDPVNTTVLITSTSYKESKGRIWADVTDYWNAADKHMQKLYKASLPGKVVASLGIIRLDDPSGQYEAADRSGIHLIAGEKSKSADSVGKMIGFKNKRLLFIADELPELSGAILDAATSNLDSSEKEWFRLIGTGNPNSIYDPHGQLSRPKAGWKSISSASHEWETDLGFCIRFDSLQSPNCLADRTIFKYLPKKEEIAEAKRRNGEDSLKFWRQWRGYWCPTGGTESVVAEADIIGYDCDQRVKKWKQPPGQFAFLDPGYTNGGDRSILYFANFGVNAETDLETLEFTEYLTLFEDTTNNKVARNFQIARKFRDECEKRKVLPDHAGVDDTGASAFGDIVHTEWSRQVVRTNFGGKASSLQVSAHDKTLSCDKYANRVSEIWTCVREYIRGSQIRGIGPDLAIELISRRLVEKKSGIDLKSQVEPKQKMRDRTKGMSPDIADAALGILDLLRSKFRFRAAAKQKINAVDKKTWSAHRRSRDFYGRHTPQLDRAA